MLCFPQRQLCLKREPDLRAVLLNLKKVQSKGIQVANFNVRAHFEAAWSEERT